MSKNTLDKILYPPIEPYATGYIDVDDIHTLYWEQCGHPDGVPILFLHGGPGGGISPTYRQFFDPDKYRIILFDQRGAGKSTPLGDLRRNTSTHLVADIEHLRKHFDIERWHIFGGSWGSTLALLYAQAYPEKCISLILRGIFLLTQPEIDWFLYGIRNIFPDKWETFAGFVTSDERDDLLSAYYKCLTSDDKETAHAAAVHWADYESSCAALLPRPKKQVRSQSDIDHDFAIARIEAHYFINEVIDEKNSILSKIDQIRHIPTTIIHGRYDVICTVKNAYELHKKWPESSFEIVSDAGHSALDPALCARLIQACNKHINYK